MHFLSRQTQVALQLSALVGAAVTVLLYLVFALSDRSIWAWIPLPLIVVGFVWRIAGWLNVRRGKPGRFFIFGDLLLAVLFPPFGVGSAAVVAVAGLVELSHPHALNEAFNGDGQVVLVLYGLSVLFASVSTYLSVRLRRVEDPATITPTAISG